jgi:hypothetical protein
MSNTPVDSRYLRPALRAMRACGAGLVGLLLVMPSSAQYAFDPSNADEQMPGVRYFGSVKDDRGNHLAGATIVIDDPQSTFIFVTDHDGRFRGVLPEDTAFAQVKLKCFKIGYRLVRVTKRPGPAKAKPTVQVDCLLRATEVS